MNFTSILNLESSVIGTPSFDHLTFVFGLGSLSSKTASSCFLTLQSASLYINFSSCSGSGSICGFPFCFN